MDSFLSNIQTRFREGDILLRIIYVNIALFLLIRLADIFLLLFNLDGTYYLRYLEFPSSGSVRGAVLHGICRSHSLSAGTHAAGPV